MLNLYCREYNCTLIKYSPTLFEAFGDKAGEVHYHYELAHAKLQLKIINAIAKREGENKRKVIRETTRDFVKNLHRESEVNV